MKFAYTYWVILLATLLIPVTRSAQGDIYLSGHADIGVGFEEGRFHIHLHAEEDLGLYGGGVAIAGEYDSDELLIGVPGPSIARPVGGLWDFLASQPGDPIWFLPQGSDPNKPFLGIGTEELSSANGWSTVTWSFESITTVSGDASEFALWQNDSVGSPMIRASSLLPTGSDNSWLQSVFSHDHFNFGFTGEGIYEVVLSVEGFNSGIGEIAAGTYSNTATFRFTTGNAVPEPGSLSLIGIAVMGCSWVRRRKNA